jgi:hypothetical protein
VQRDRLDVALTARLVASFPELKALFATDPATVRHFVSLPAAQSGGAAPRGADP